MKSRRWFFSLLGAGLGAGAETLKAESSSLVAGTQNSSLEKKISPGTPSADTTVTSLLSGDGSQIGVSVPGGIQRTLYLNLLDVRTDKQYGAIGDSRGTTLAEEFSSIDRARKFWPNAVSLQDTFDLVAAERAVSLLIKDNEDKPKYLELPPGDRVFNRPLVINPSLDCETPVENITIVGGGGHRSYDSGGNLSSSIRAVGDMQSVIDLRACRYAMLRGIGISTDGLSARGIWFGAAGCKNVRQMYRVLTLDNVQVKGARRGIDGYLFSGMNIRQCNFSRARHAGISINAGGDWEIVESLINNCGPLVYGGLEAANVFEGAALLIYGGGGHGRIAGGKIEVCNKGVVAHNTHSILVDGTTFDKNAEAAIIVESKNDTSGETNNLGYRALGWRIVSCEFIASGWLGDKYNCHIYVSNTGTDNDVSIIIANCTAFWAGENAIPGDRVATGMYGVGPTRSAIRAIAGGTGVNTYIQVNGGDWSKSVVTAGGQNESRTAYLFESYQPGVTFEAIGQVNRRLNTMEGGKVKPGLGAR